MADLAHALAEGRAGRLDRAGFLAALAQAPLWVPVVPDPTGGAPRLRVFSWQDAPTAAAFRSAALLDAFGEVSAHGLDLVALSGGLATAQAQLPPLLRP